jgi:DNA-binding response OmpR family regulator
MDVGKILIVEDAQSLSSALKYNLSKEGYNVVIAVDGVQALELARSERPDLIILDIMLPKLDGFEVCRILRKDMISPILMLTASVEEVDKVLGLGIGADD